MSATSNLVQQLYVCFYGRPADPDGLAFWTQQIDSNPASLESVIGAFENSAESQALHGTLDSVQERITVLYQAFFGREPDLPGMMYWAQAAEGGHLTMGGLTLAIMNAAQGLDQVRLDEMVQVANAFTNALADEGYHYGGDAAAAVGRTLIAALSDPQHTAQEILQWVADFACTADFATHNPYLLEGLTDRAGHVPLNLVSADISPEAFYQHLSGSANSFGSPGVVDGIPPEPVPPEPVVPDTEPPGGVGVALVRDTGASDTDLITNDATLALTGLEERASVQYSTDGAMWSSSFAPQEGDNTVYVRQVDAASNVGPETGPFHFTLDTTAATVAIGLGSISTGKGEPSFTLTLTSSEDVTAGLYVGSTLLGSTLDLAGGVAATTGSITPQASVSVATMHMTDIAGNMSTSSSSVIIGTTGADLITGTAGQDLMYGDGGADTFQLVAGGTIDLDCLDQVFGYTTSGKDQDAIAAGGTATVWDTDLGASGWTLGLTKGSSGGSSGILSKSGATVADFYAAVQSAGAHAGEVAGFLSGGNLYLYGEGVSAAGGDNTAVVLLGIASVPWGISITAGKNAVHIVDTVV